MEDLLEERTSIPLIQLSTSKSFTNHLYFVLFALSVSVSICVYVFTICVCVYVYIQICNVHIHTYDYTTYYFEIYIFHLNHLG